MKKLLYIPLFILALICSTVSCSKDEELKKEEIEVPEDNDNEDGEEEEPGEGEEEPEEPENPGEEGDGDEDGDNDPDEPEIPGDSKMLIAYFSYPEPDGVDASTGASRLVIDEVVTGHLEFLARVIEDATGANVFRIETVQQYPASHAPLIAQAQEELNNGVRPELKTKIENLDQYDIIFIGYPNWWGNLPAPLYTFLESYDFNGKTIIPFNSHGGSGFSNTINTIRGYHPDANVLSGFTVSRNTVGQAENDVLSWLRRIEVVD